ncbi:hypothetical protein MUCCIDRAFT_104593 [Mucor lusitanicus CBS 277.49]|uniref:RxLR effector protein n=1 Tax=Mucor lusitanicus CBS 277.49 TaxID=747725 RepID=A0A168PFC0_MUCCL|nr:hypothetical protein MUCCIDRAFT_104593 [Mucor lusitanicus CBS 277.49]
MHAKFLLAISLLVCVLGISNAAPALSGTGLQLNEVNGLTSKKLTKRGRSLADAVVSDDDVDVYVPVTTKSTTIL